MFEPAVEMEKVKVGIAAAAKYSESYFAKLTHYMPLNILTEEALQAKQLDLLLVHGASAAQTRLIDKACATQNCAVATIDSSGSDSQASCNVMLNLKAKLDSDEMPNNLDVVDVRHLAACSSQLLAFDNHQELFNYLQSAADANLKGCIYLAHGDISLDIYTELNNRISSLLPSSALFISSLLFAGRAECTAIVAVQTNTA